MPFGPSSSACSVNRDVSQRRMAIWLGSSRRGRTCDEPSEPAALRAKQIRPSGNTTAGRDGAHDTLDPLIKLLSKGVKALKMDGARSLPGVACLLCRDVARIGVDLCVIKLFGHGKLADQRESFRGGGWRPRTRFHCTCHPLARLAKPVTARRSLRSTNGPVPCIAVLGVRVCWTIRSLRRVAYRRPGTVQKRLLSRTTPDLSVRLDRSRDFAKYQVSISAHERIRKNYLSR
jgi:hypothetical protein